MEDNISIIEDTKKNFIYLLKRWKENFIDIKILDEIHEKAVSIVEGSYLRYNSDVNELLKIIDYLINNMKENYKDSDIVAIGSNLYSMSLRIKDDKPTNFIGTDQETR